MDYDAVINTFQDEFSYDLTQRQAHLLQRVARFNADGYLARDFPKLNEIFIVAFDALESHGGAFVAPLCDLVKLLGKPYRRLASNEEHDEANTSALGNILTLVADSLACGHAALERDAAQSLLAFVLAIDFDEKKGTAADVETAWEFHQQLLAESGSLERIVVALQQHASSFISYIQGAASPFVEEKTSERTPARAISSETVTWLAQLIRESSENLSNSCLLVELGVLGTISDIIDGLENISDPLLPLAVEILWNLLEQSHALVSSDASPPSSLVQLVDKHRNNNALMEIGTLAHFQCLSRLLQKLIRRGFTQAAKELRNDVVVISMVLARNSDNITLFAASGLFDLLLTLSIAAENELSLAVPLSHFAAATDADHEFKLLVWALIHQLSRSDKFWGWVDRDTGETVSTELQLPDQLIDDFNSGRISSCLYAIQDAPFTDTLLRYLDVNQRAHPYLSLWTPPQRRSIELSALRLVMALMPFIGPRFEEKNGEMCLMRYMAAYSGLDQSDIPLFNAPMGAPAEVDFGRMVAAARALSSACCSPNADSSIVEDTSRFVHSVAPPGLEGARIISHPSTALSVLASSTGTDFAAKAQIQMKDIEMLRQAGSTCEDELELLSLVAFSGFARTSGLPAQPKPANAARIITSMVQSGFIHMLVALVGVVPDSDLPTFVGSSTRRLLPGATSSMQNVTAAELVTEGRTVARPSDVKEAILCLLAAITWDLVILQQNPHVLTAVEHADAFLPDGSDITAPTDDLDADCVGALRAAQETFRLAGGIPALVRILKHAVVEARAGNMAETSPVGERGRVSLTAMQALMSLVWGNAAATRDFAAVGGVDAVLDLLERAPLAMLPVCFAVLATICSSDTCKANVLAWRSDLSGNTLAHVLADSWTAEEKRHGVYRPSACRLTTAVEGRVLDCFAPLDPEHAASTSSLTAFKSLRRALTAGRQSGHSAGAPGVERFPGNFHGAVSAAFDLRPRMYPAFAAIGFDVLEAQLQTCQDGGPNYPRLITLASVKAFPELLFGSAWHDVDQRLAGLGIPPMGEDVDQVQHRLGRSRDALEALQAVQKGYLQEFTVTEQSKQQALSDTLVFARTTLPAGSKAARKSLSFGDTANSTNSLTTGKFTDPRLVTMDERKLFQQQKQAMLARSFIGYKPLGESAIVYVKPPEEGDDVAAQEKEEAIQSQDVLNDSLDYEAEKESLASRSELE